MLLHVKRRTEENGPRNYPDLFDFVLLSVFGHEY